MKNLINEFADTVFPNKCPVCDKAVFTESYCKKCLPKMQTIKEETCFQCGLPQKVCECNKFVYHFDGIVAPYFNEGAPQKAIYRFKFKHRFTLVPLMGDVMAQFAANKFGIENIDLITFVPMAITPYRVRGFNQSELLAQTISQKLGIELDGTILQKRKWVFTQHYISKLDTRFSNVRNAFYTTKTIKGKNVLLVDDIKTSGATLDECARQLKFAGANMVYCVTALVTSADNL